MDTLTHGQAVEQVVLRRLGVSLEDLDILEHLRVDLDFLLIHDTILTQKPQLDCARRNQGDVFESEGTTTDGIGLFLSLFISRSERQTIDQVHGRRSLSVGHDLALQLGRIVFSDDIDILLDDIVVNTSASVQGTAVSRCDVGAD
jgi:hypothetical protein